MRKIEDLVTYKSGTFPNTLGVNSTGPSTKDGTELIANLFNDYIGVFPQALLNEMGISPSGNAETATVCQQLDALKGTIARLGNGWGVIGRAAVDTAHDVTLSVGNVPDSTRAYQLRLTTEITKMGDTAWVAGNNAGGLMGGTWSAFTEYGVYLIYNPTTRVLDAGFSVYTGAGIPTFLPSGFTVYRMVDWVKTDGSSNIIQTTTTSLGGGKIRKIRTTPALDINRLGTLGTTRILDTIFAPTGFKTKCISTLYLTDVLSFYAFVGDPDFSDILPSGTSDSTHYRSAGLIFVDQYTFYTNLSAQVAARASLVVDTYALSVREIEFSFFN